MFTDDKIAAAQLARIFGSELLKVQQSARTDSGGVPDIVKMDPKHFLMQKTAVELEQQNSKNRELILALQREAEAAYPLPSSYTPPPSPEQTIQKEPVQVNPSTLISQPPKAIQADNFNNSSEIVNALKDISAKIETLSESILGVISQLKR